MATDLMTALVERSLRTLPFSRTERNGSTMAISLRSARESMALRGRFQGGHGVRVAEADAGQHLAAVGAQGLERGRGVAGKAVIEFVHQAGEPATVHRAEEQLALERAEQEQIVHDVRRGEDTVHVRVGQGDLQAVQELAAVGHGHRIVADRERAAGGVVGGDDEVLPVGPDAGVAAPGLGGAGNRFRVFEPDDAQVLVAAGIIVHRDGWRRLGVTLTVLLLRWRRYPAPGGRGRRAGR